MTEGWDAKTTVQRTTEIELYERVGHHPPKSEISNTFPTSLGLNIVRNNANNSVGALLSLSLNGQCIHLQYQDYM